MQSMARGWFGKFVVFTIVGLLALVFAFVGDFTPTQYSAGPSDAGSVNGEVISAREFNRVINNYARSMQSRGFSMEQLKQFGIYNMAFDQIVNQKLVVQEAEKMDVLPSDKELQDQIRNLPYFQEEGRFSFQKYKQLLKANNLSAAEFEESIRDELTAQKWMDHLRRRTWVSEVEVVQEFRMNNEKRNVRFVMIDDDTGKNAIDISKEEIQGLLADADRAAQVKNRYDLAKETRYKDKEYDAVKEEIAKEFLLDEKGSQIRQENEKIANSIAEKLTHRKSSESAVASILKKHSLKVEETGMFNQKSAYLKGIGNSSEVKEAAFSANSPIDTKAGGKAKVYTVARGLVVAVLAAKGTADLTKLDENEKRTIRSTLRTSKENRVYGDWLNNVKSRSNVVRNEKMFASN